MASPRRLLILALLLAFPATEAAGKDQRPFDNVAPAAELIEKIIKAATFRTVPGQRQILVLWQDKPGSVTALTEVLKRRLPQYAVVPLGIEFLQTTQQPNAVSAIAVNLSPDALQTLSNWSRRHGVLTVGAEADIDPLSVGLLAEGNQTPIFCSKVAMTAERVTVGICRPLPGDRTLTPGMPADRGGNDELVMLHAERRRELVKWTRSAQQGAKTTAGPAKPIPDAVRNKLHAVTRATQHEIGVRPGEGWIELPVVSSNRDPRLPFLPHYQLGNALYLLGNCQAAIPALQESLRQDRDLNVWAATKLCDKCPDTHPEKAALQQLLKECTDRIKPPPNPKPPLVGQATGPE